MRIVPLLLLLASGIAWAEPPAGPPDAAPPRGRVVATLGPQQVILESGRQGLRCFPDGCLAFVRSTPPYRLLVAAEVSTSLLEGPDMRSLVSLGEVIKPGKAGSFDNGYAGIGGVARDPTSGELLAFYHAETTKACVRFRRAFPDSIAA